MPKARIIDGRAIADELLKAIRSEVATVKRLHRLTPGLAVVLVGENPASKIYVGRKIKQTDEIGMKSFSHRLPTDVREEHLLTLIEGLNRDERVNGILVQLPLPEQIRSEEVLSAIDPDKDVDGFHVVNAGRLATGVPGALIPCTPFGCLHLIRRERPDMTGLKAVIVGRSNIVGKPMALLLLAENCTVTIAHSKTADLPAVCREADILVAAVGVPRMIQGDWIKPGAVVIDVGINRLPGDDDKVRLAGDVDFDQAIHVAGAITPVPGGVGPMTVACLLRNTLIAACRQRNLEEPDV
jgi:methylenetetrahydrofolate dehydrogenase (NADP+)/methenyltetrahydrofolate cyclohydrolase